MVIAGFGDSPLVPWYHERIVKDQGVGGRARKEEPLRLFFCRFGETIALSEFLSWTGVGCSGRDSRLVLVAR